MTSSTKDKPAPRRKRVWLRRLVLVLVLLFLVGAPLATYLLRHRIADRLLENLVRKVEDSSGGSLTIGQADLDLLRLKGDLGDVRLEIPQEAGPPFLASVRTVSASFSVGDLLRLPAGQISIRSLEVVGPDIRFDRSFLERPARDTGEDLALDLKIGVLAIRDGRFRYEGKNLPLAVDVRNLVLSAEWDDAARLLDGAVSFQSDLVGGPFRTSLPLDISSRFRQRGTRAELTRMVAEAEAGRAELTEATVSWDDGVRITGTGEVEGDLARFGELLSPGMPVLAGEVGGDLRLEYGAGELLIHSRIEGHSVQVGPVRTGRVSADASIDLDALTLDRLEGTAFGGAVSGSIQVPWNLDRELRMDLAGAAMSAERLFRLLELPLPFAADTDLTFRFVGSWPERSTWNGSGKAVLRSREIDDLIPVDGEGEFGIRAGVLQVDAPRFITSGGLFSATVNVDLVHGRSGEGQFLRLAGQTDDAGRTRDITSRILERFDTALPDTLMEPLSGSGDIQAEIGLGEQTFLDMTLDLADGSWGPEPYRRLSFRTLMEGDQVRIRDMDIDSGDWTLAGELELGLAAGDLVSASLTARRFPLERVLQVTGMVADATGLLSGRVRLRPGEDGVHGDGEMTMEEAVIAGFPAGVLAGSVRAEAGRIRIGDLTVNGPGIEADLDVQYDMTSGEADFRILRSTILPSELPLYDGEPPPFQAPAEVAGTVQYRDEEFSGLLEVQGSGWSLAGHDLPDLAARVRLEPAGLEARIHSREGDSLESDLTLGWDDGLPLVLHLKLGDYRLLLGDPSDATPMWTRLSGSVEVRGDLADLDSLTADGSLEQMDIRVGAHHLNLDRPAPLLLNRERLVVGPVELGGEVSDLRARLTLLRDDGSVSMDVTGKVALAALAAPLPDLRARGNAEVDLHLAGTLEDPDLTGQVRFQDGWVRLLGFPQPLEQVRGIIRFGNDEAELSAFSARFGGGELSGEGGLQFDRFTPDSYFVSLIPVNTRIGYPEGFRGVYEGDLLLRGDRTDALISGRLELLRGLYQEPFDMAALLGYGAREYSADELVMLPVPVTVRLDISAADGIWIKNDVAELETSLDLDINGNVSAPEVTGRITILEGGRIRFRDVEYRIRSGSLELLDLNKINPYMDITAVTTVNKYEVTLRIEGTLDRFEYDLTSVPSLSQQDILALLTTGYTLEDMAAGPGSSGLDLTGDMAASYFASALTGLFENQLKKVFRLERVRINPYAASGSADPTTQLTLGKEVADNLFIIYSTELGGEERQIYKVDWQVTRKFNLTAESDSDAGIGGGLEFSNRFWLGRERGDAEEATVAGRPADQAETIVRSVALPGLSGEDSAKMRKALPLKEGEPYRRARLFEGAEEIRRIYVREGHILAAVEPDVSHLPDQTGVDVIYAVDPGPVYQVRFEGVPAKVEKGLRKELEEMWIESIFVDEGFEDSKVSVQQYFQKRGHYTVDVSVEIDAETGRGAGEKRAVVFRIDPGPRVAVQSLTFEGNASIEEARLRKQVLTSTGSTFGKDYLFPKTLESDLGAIRNLYRDNGHLLVQTPPPRIRLLTTGDQADIVLRVAEGPRFTVSGVEFPEPGPFDPDQMAGWAGLPTGGLFSPRALLEAEGRLRGALDREGYPEARVDGSGIIAEDTVLVRFKVIPGQRATVGDIRIEGNHRTQDKIIRRELTFKRGETISRASILKSQHNLYRLGLFSRVRIDYQPEAGASGDAFTMVVQVRESPPFRLRVGAGYSSEYGARGEVVVTHENVGGYDRSLTLHARASEQERWLQVLIEEPRLFTQKWPALISMISERQEEIGYSFRRRSGALRVEHEFRQNWKRFLRYNLQRVDLFDIQAGSEDLILEQKLEDLDLGDIGFALVRDTRDDPFLTRKGQYLSSELRLFAPALGSDASFGKFSARGSFTRTFDGGGTFASGLRLGLAETYGPTTRVPLSERFFAGGDRTHRGFARDQLGPRGSNGVPLGGESMLLFSQEWRQPLWRMLRGVVFYDAGNVYLTLPDFRPGDLRHALGLGLHVETPIGPIRVEYGHKLDREDGESRGEYFLSIGQIF
ncbi:MAG: outer membrane protein assembly factor BamA [Acidobacteria bacterium]|uniref:Outer membrane protein assembly factor BamA n=1 Tax=Candidatus Polarisedimenticola svalbardensis TaxID=2886004 RepID=A0A8J6XTQ3_9BACT|nr:outer membrane protein assembly factor BamA [Candidatus Polarisedimenticola svalbardensis]